MAGIVRKREGQSREISQQQQQGTRPSQLRPWSLDPFRSLGFADPFRRMREMLSWEPFAEMESMLPSLPRSFAPDLEVRETKDGYAICADLPGLTEENVSVDVSGRRLTICGKREEEQRDESDRYWAYERSYGSFTRSFTLPEGVDVDRIDACLSNGVLEVFVPKAKVEESKHIHVKGEARAAQSHARPQAGGGAAQHAASQATTGAGGAEQGAAQGGSREKAA